jgi:hypothetical protein
VSHYGLAIYIKKYLKAKEELWKNLNISPCKNIIFKTSSKRNHNPSRHWEQAHLFAIQMKNPCRFISMFVQLLFPPKTSTQEQVTWAKLKSFEQQFSHFIFNFFSTMFSKSINVVNDL